MEPDHAVVSSAVRVSDEEVSRSVFLPNAIAIPGVLHICHNAEHDASSHMSQWEWFWQRLKTLQVFLAHRGRREAFVESCLLNGPCASRAVDFKNSVGSLYESRWSEVGKCCAKIVPLLPILRMAWDAKKYRQRLTATTASEASFNPDDVTRIVNDNLFFAYMNMVVLLDSAFASLGSWAEGCPCHEDLLLGETNSRQRKIMRTEFPSQPLWATCPTRGKRLPELAVGEWRVHLDGLMSRNFADLAMAKSPCPLMIGGSLLVTLRLRNHSS